MTCQIRIRKVSALHAAIAALLCAGTMFGASQVAAQEFAGDLYAGATDALSAASVPQQFAAAQTRMDAASLPTAAAQLQTLDGVEGINNAVVAAVADGVTTGMALSAGALELNPLMPTSPIGLIAVTGVKIGLAKYAETLPEAEKRLTMKASSAIWGGAAVNNLMVLMAAPPPIPVIVGLVTGFATWMHMQSQYEEADRIAAANRETAIAANEGDTQSKVLTVAMDSQINQSAGE